MLRFLWFVLLFCSVLIPIESIGQSLVTNVPQIDFGIVLETEPQSIPLIITNVSNDYVNVLDIQFFDTFGDPAFFSNTMSFALEPNETKTIEITFAPIHNIVHNTEMFIVTQNRGAFSVDLIGQGRYSNDYYFATENKVEQELFSSLNFLIATGTVDLGYGPARDNMFMSIDNQSINGLEAEDNTLEGVYTGEVLVGYASRQDAQDDGFNTEHTWPQSLGAGSSPMRSDLFHIFPTNENANSRRGSKKFGVVMDSIPDWEVGGSKDGGDLFEPRDAHKGTGARALFYFATRYKNQTGVNTSWLASQEEVLRQWHLDFPPTEVEENRNEAIYGLQNNRNPFIDYPQFVERIEHFTEETETVESEYFLPNEVIDFGYIDTMGLFNFVFPIYNIGETDLTFTNFNFVGSEDLSIDFPMDSVVTIPPGEDFSLVMYYDADDETGDWGQLEFEQVAGEPIEIPVFANIEVGVTQAKLSESLSLYPNPARNTLNIVVSEEFTTKKNLKIYNANGQSVYEGNLLSGSRQQLSLDQFQNGIYWLQLDCLGQSVIKPFVIQK